MVKNGGGMSKKSSQNVQQTPKELVDTLIREMYEYAMSNLRQKLNPPNFDYSMLTKDLVKSLQTKASDDVAKTVIIDASETLKLLDGKMKNIKATISSLPTDEQNEVLHQINKQKKQLLAIINYSQLVLRLQELDREISLLLVNMPKSNHSQLQSKLEVLKKHFEILDYELTSHQMNSVLVFKLRQSINMNMSKVSSAIEDSKSSAEFEDFDESFNKSESYLSFMKESTSSLLNSGNDEKKRKTVVKDMATRFVHEVILEDINYHEDLKIILEAARSNTMSFDQLNLYLQFSKSVYDNFVNNKIYTSKMLDSLTGDLKQRVLKELFYIEEALLSHIKALELKSENAINDRIALLEEKMVLANLVQEKTLLYIQATQDSIQGSQRSEPKFVENLLYGLKKAIELLREEMQENTVIISNTESEFSASSEVKASLGELMQINLNFKKICNEDFPELMKKLMNSLEEKGYADIKLRIQASRDIIDNKKQILSNYNQSQEPTLDSFSTLKNLIDQLKLEYQKNQRMINELDKFQGSSKNIQELLTVLHSLNKDLHNAMHDVMVKIKVLGGQDVVLSRISEIKLLKPNWEQIDHTLQKVETKLMSEASLLKISQYKMLNAQGPLKLTDISAINLETLLSRSSSTRREVYQAISYLDGLKNLLQERGTDSVLLLEISKYQHALLYKDLCIKHPSMKMVCDKIIAIVMDKQDAKKADFSKYFLQACDEYAKILIPNPKSPMSTEEVQKKLEKISELPAEMQIQVMNKFPQFDQQMQEWTRTRPAFKEEQRADTQNSPRDDTKLD